MSELLVNDDQFVTMKVKVPRVMVEELGKRTVLDLVLVALQDAVAVGAEMMGRRTEMTRPRKGRDSLR